MSNGHCLLLDSVFAHLIFVPCIFFLFLYFLYVRHKCELRDYDFFFNQFILKTLLSNIYVAGTLQLPRGWMNEWIDGYRVRSYI